MTKLIYNFTVQQLPPSLRGEQQSLSYYDKDSRVKELSGYDKYVIVIRSCLTTEGHQLFIGTLFLKDAIDEDRAIMLAITPMMRELERAGRLHITEENKVYLTELGRLTGLGAIKMYSEYF
jgi:hypothetical protein